MKLFSARLALVTFGLCLSTFLEISGSSLDASSFCPSHFSRDEPYLHRLHHATYHPFGCTDTGSIMQLTDSSKWFVTNHKRIMVTHWKKSDEIFIKPAHSAIWPQVLISYKYVLYNRTKNEVAEVALKSPPLPMGVETRVIQHIEPYQRLVQLSDGTVWQIDPSDTNFQDWRQGHRLMIGVNNGWRTAVYPQILVNVDLGSGRYSQAVFYPYR